MASSGVTRVGVVLLVFVLISVACGGGTNDGAASPSSSTGASDVDTTPAGNGGSGDDDGDVVGSSSEVGAPTLQAEPGMAWVEVDGERLEYGAAGSLFYECSIAEDRVIVNFQTADGHDLAVVGSQVNGQWNVSANFGAGSGAEFGYGGPITVPNGRLGMNDSALSYEGPVSRVLLSDRTKTDSSPVRIAVNCATAGEDPTVTVGGQSFSVPFAGAQSISCEASPGDIDVLINRLSTDGLQIQISVRTEGSGLVGAVSLFTPAGSYTGVVPPDGAGLEVDGDTVSFEGTFTTPDGGEVDGVASVSCP